MSHRKRVKKTWLQIATEVTQELDFLGYDSTKVVELGLYGDWYCFEAPGREPQDLLCIEVHRKGYGWRHYAKRERDFTNEEQEEFCRRTREELEKMLPSDTNGVVAYTLSGNLGVTKEVMTHQTPSSWADILTM